MLRIVDRIKRVIIVGSANVWPADIESVLVSCARIEEAAVIGRPDDELGEGPVAFVVPAQDAALDAGEVKRLFDGRLAAYKHPQDVILVDALPRNAIGKVELDELRRSLDRPPGRAAAAAAARRRNADRGGRDGSVASLTS